MKLSKLGVQHVREEDDDRGLPAHNFSFVSIAAIGQLAAGTHVHVLGSAQNIKVARDAICDLIIGAPPGKVYNRMRTVAKRLHSRL